MAEIRKSPSGKGSWNFPVFDFNSGVTAKSCQVGSIPMHFRQREFKGIACAGYPLFSLRTHIHWKALDLFRFPLLKLVVIPAHTEGQLALCDKFGAGVITFRGAVNDFVFSPLFDF